MKKGFTLIELLAVIIILAVVALIATPQVLEVINEAKDSSRTSSLSGYADAVKLKATTDYFNNDGVYSTCFDLNDLVLNNNSVVCSEGYYTSDNKVLLGNCTVNGEGTYWYVNGKVTNSKPDDFDSLKGDSVTSNSCHQTNTVTPDSCFTFNVGTGTITNYDFDNCSSDVVIPDTIGGVNVQNIGQGAFVDVDNLECMDTNSNIILKDKDYIHTSTINDGYIACAFAISKNFILDSSAHLITSVILPQYLKTISLGGFQSQLIESITIPDSVTSIGDYAFTRNVSMVNAKIGNGVTNIGNYSFMYNSLSNLTFGNAIETIGMFSFRNNQLTKVDIPENVTMIDVGTFSFNQLTEVDIHENVTRINTAAFAYNRLTNICIPGNVTRIGESAFQNNYIVQGAAVINNIMGNVVIETKAFLNNGTNSTETITPLYSSDFCG